MRYIGKKYDRVDGIEKITGKAKYVDDYYKDDMLYVAVVRSTLPHAKIKSINTEKAKNEDVSAIFTGKDFPGDNSYGYPVCDNTILCKEEAKYIGDAIAIVCAKSRDAAKKAAGLVEIEYEELPTVFDAKESKDMLHKLVIKKNINKESSKENSELLKNGENCENDESSEIVTLNIDISTKHQEHMYIEPEGAFAYFENGILNVYAPMQSPFTARGVISKILNMPEDKVRVVQTTVGGAFGGKDDVIYEACGFVSLGTYKTGKPCKYVASREESIISSYKRHPVNAHVTLTADKSGKFKDIKIRTRLDGGAYAAVSNFVLYRYTTHSAGPYVYDSVDAENEVYYTNNVYAGAFRGFGGLQACYVYDTAVDEMSYLLHTDPIELRLKNIWRKGSLTATNQRIETEPSIEYMLKRIKEVSNWTQKRGEFEDYNKKSRYYKKGIGVSLGYHGISLGAEGDDFAQSEVIYRKNSDKLLITCGISELGQGSRTVFSQIASEMLELPSKFIEVNNYDTDVIMQSGPTVASRGSTVGGRAVMKACENFLEHIKDLTAEYYSIKKENIKYKEGYLSIGQHKSIFLLDFCSMLSGKKGEIRSLGRFDMPAIDWSEKDGLGIPYQAYHFGVHCSYITVDMVTGMITVDKYFAVHDIGRVLNPALLKGQIIGGVAMGLGYSLMEDIGIHNGKIENDNFDKYIIPTSEDVPDIYTEAVESNEPIGPFGAKGTGEPVVTPVPSCIGNALRFATGKRITSLPYSLEKIVLGKELRKYGR